MSREIKFRAWDKEEGQMLYSGKEYYDYDFRCDEHGNLMCYSNCSYTDTFGDEHDEWIKLDNIMQYTGLHDNKRTEEYPEGQPIYEGDILDGSYINPMTEHKVKRIYKVEFSQGNFAARLIGASPFGDTLLYFQNEKSNVIGNIYDNPELLQEASKNAE